MDRSGFAILSVALLLVLAVGGCASSSGPVRVSYSESSDETTYKTRLMQLRDIEVQSGLSSPGRYFVQVESSCTGQDCVPSTYTLRFLRKGRQEVRMASQEVSLTIGDETIQWQDPRMTQPSGNAVDEPIRIRSGTVCTVQVSGGQLSTIGSVRSVNGQLGNSDFTLPYDGRVPIRQLVARLDAKSGSESASDSASDSPSRR
jgi:hypothetical protein